jgi:predicted nucleic acid-binding protein
MRHFFVDTNVLIDYLAGRRPFADDAADLFNQAIAGKVQLYMASISISNSYYIISRHYRNLNIRALLLDLLPWVIITDVSADVMQQALHSTFTDFEDALQYFSALTVPQIEVIVTRNGKDFGTAGLPVVEPAMALTLL